jgi:hypothetical protein
LKYKVLLKIQIMKKNHVSLGIYGTASLLLILPLVAMQFTSKVDWKPLDFVLAGILLYGTALGIDTVQKRVKDKQKAVLYAGAILLVLFIIWAELAVGILGTPFAGS